MALILPRNSMLFALKFGDLSNFAVCIANFDDKKSTYHFGSGRGDDAATSLVAWTGAC